MSASLSTVLILGDVSSSRLDHTVSLLVYSVNLEVFHHVRDLILQSKAKVACQ
jgi:hypothetical protein